MSVEPDSIPVALVPTPTGPLVVPEAAPDGGGLQLSLIIPTFNESKNVGEMVARLTTLLDKEIPGAYELIVVDDDGKDKTWEIALELSRQYPSVRVIRRVGERGLSTAVIRGWQAARGDVLAVIDAGSPASARGGRRTVPKGSRRSRPGSGQPQRRRGWRLRLERPSPRAVARGSAPRPADLCPVSSDACPIR